MQHRRGRLSGNEVIDDRNLVNKKGAETNAQEPGSKS
jgi:hypothetical protein